jgi:hypothetical protein
MLTMIYAIDEHKLENQRLFSAKAVGKRDQVCRCSINALRASTTLLRLKRRLFTALRLGRNHEDAGRSADLKSAPHLKREMWALFLF